MTINRDYRLLPVDQTTDEELLFELLSRNTPSTGPKKVQFHEPHVDSLIGIGNDHVSNIFIASEAFEELKKRVANRNSGIKY